MTNLRVFYAKTLLSWGFIVRHRGTSAAQPAYPIPPPTTVVGAFAYPLVRLLGFSTRGKGIGEWGEGKLVSEVMKPLLEATITASAGLISLKFASKSPMYSSYRTLQVGLAIYQEISRIIASPYKSGGSFQKAVKAKFMESDFFKEALPVVLPVQATGAAYAPALKIELMWVVDIEKLSRELGVSVEKLDGVARKAIYGIVRIGSKEGLVALEEVIYAENPVTRGPGEKVSTRLYVERFCAETLNPTLTTEIVIPDLRYSLTPYYMPAFIGSSNLIVPLSEDMPPPTFRILSPCKAIIAPGLEAAVGVARL